MRKEQGLKLKKENAELKEKIKGLVSGEVCLQGDMDATIKQNLELKTQIEQLQQAYTITVDKSVIREQELEAQIEQLSNDNHVLKTSFITQQEQIEKMKNCLNCKHDNELDTEFCQNCDRPYKGEPLKDEWELG